MSVNLPEPSPLINTGIFQVVDIVPNEHAPSRCEVITIEESSGATRTFSMPTTNAPQVGTRVRARSFLESIE